MSKYIRPIVIGTVLAFVIAFGLAFTFSRLGAPNTSISIYCGLFVGIFTAYILANLAGNRKVATADTGQLSRALAMAAPADAALVYVYRQGFVGKAAGMNVIIDGKTVAQLTSPRFTVVKAAPGQHDIFAAFGGLAGPQNKAAATAFTAEPGAVLVFRLNLSMGMVQNTINVTPVPDLAEVKRALSTMKMTVAELAEV
ncbi:MAG TPA: hypothetical protein VF459_19750 [Caulobacteraceae bacterium]